MLTAVTGINWGDEGKGRIVDLLAEKADVVVIIASVPCDFMCEHERPSLYHVIY